MRILVACEESQRVTIALRERGHEAYSCDIIPCSGGHPEWHLQQDVTPLLKEKWDMIIAFPPCTYMTNAGACRMYPQKGVIDEERLKLGLEAKEFFMKFYNANCEKIAIENPRPLKVIGLPPETQRIQPYMFGEPYSKLTYLWLKGLPELTPTKILTEYKPFVSCGTSRNKGNPDKAGFSRRGGAAKVRSKTFIGIAEAMADQWAGDIREESLNVKKVEEVKTITYECDDLIDVAALKEKEPELYEELVRDYPAESATYVFKNKIA